MWRVLERELTVFRHLWRSAAFSNFAGPALFLFAMGIGVGGMMHGAIGGLPYLQFVAPGLMAASAMQLAAGEAMWPVLGGMKWVRSFHGMVATPIRPSEVYTGFLSWIAVRGAMASVAFLIVAAAIGGVRSPWALLAIPASVLGAIAFGAPLSAFSATQETDAGFGLIMRIGIVPLFLFSGTFFPVHELPAWLRPVAAFSPLWHAVELSRAAWVGHGAAVATTEHLAVLAGCVAAGVAWGSTTFSRRLAP